MSTKVLRLAAAAALAALLPWGTASAQSNNAPKAAPSTAPAQAEQPASEPVEQRPAPSAATAPAAAEDPYEAQDARRTAAPDNLAGPTSGYILDGEARDEPTAKPVESGGILGRWWVTDLVLLFLTALLGAGAGALLGSQSSRRRNASDLHPLKVRLDSIETGLRAQAKLSSSAASPSPRSPAETARQDYRVESAPRAPQAPSPQATPSGQSQDARTAQQEVSRRIGQAADDYCNLIATKGAKPRQFADALAAFPEVLAIQQQGSTMVAGPYRENDANQFVVAAGDGENFVVLPTYEYVSDFAMAFSKPVMNPESVRLLFDFSEGDGGQLQIGQPAIVELDDTGLFHVKRKGQLSGFRS